MLFPEDSLNQEGQYQLILNFLEVLHENNFISFPKNKKDLWNHSYNPSLPKWIKILKIQKDSVEKKLRNYMWSVYMIWASKLKGVKRKAFDNLVKLDDWFTHKYNEKIEFMPIKERSLQIFGDEKELDRIRNNKWFQDNLTLDKLRCYITDEPLQNQPFLDAITNKVIIVENRDTFNSICRANNNYYQIIIYGSGDAIEKRILSIDKLSPDCKEIEYFGDIDGNGLEIPKRLNNILKNNDYEYKIIPAIDLYEKTVELYTLKKPMELQSVIIKYDFLKSFPDEIAQKIQNILNQKKKIMQEIINYTIIKEIIEKKIIILKD